jgi:hypothetical protein
MEPVAKPPVLQLAGGAKLRPAKAVFGVTSCKPTIYSNIAEDGGRPGADVRRGFAITSMHNGGGGASAAIIFAMHNLQFTM